MSTEIATQQAGDIALPDYFKDIVSNREYLGYVKQHALNAKEVAEDRAKAGNFSFVAKKDEFIDLGRSVDFFVVADRPQAMDLAGDKPLVYIDVNHDEFKRIKVQADRDRKDLTVSYGPCFLIWIPSISKFATWYLQSWTAKQQAKTVYSMMGKWITVEQQMKKSPEHSWHAFVVKPCSVANKAPEPEELAKSLEEFKTAPAVPIKDTTNSAAPADR